MAAVTTGPEWGLSFSYDGFGNRTAQTVTKGSGPTSLVNIDPNTNRITSYGYDQNGNMLTNPASAAGTLSYDVENRLAAVYPSAGGGEMYGYTGDNKRVYKRLPDLTEEYYFYGGDGRKLGTYSVTTGPIGGVQRKVENLYFAGKLIGNRDAFGGYQPLAVDRLGSVRSTGRYYPYGEEQQTTQQDREKFATY